MAEPALITAAHSQPSGEKSALRRYTWAALVYFLYGLFYLFGAQYLANMPSTERARSNPEWFFALGALLVVLLPWLIVQRFALAFSWHGRRHTQRKTLYIDFTLLLGVLVSVRVLMLLVSQAYLKTPWHLAALSIACINATCLVWAGLSRPVWIHRETLETPTV